MIDQQNGTKMVTISVGIMQRSIAILMKLGEGKDELGH
jgi:hypothetical protein